MKTTSLPPFVASACAAVMFLTPAFASDLFHLKDGRVLQGTILSDREDSYLLEVQVTRSIKDEVVVAKDDILRIEREDPDGPAFAAVQQLTPIPDLLTLEEYAGRIRTIEEFIKAFPESASRSEAQAILDAHFAELPTIEAGGIKFDDTLLDANQRLANAYEIESRIAEAAIHKSIHEGSLLFALRQFHEFEKKFSGSEAWRGLLPLIRQVTASHQNTARSMLEEYDTLMEMQQVGLGRMSHEDRNNANRAIEERNANLKARYDIERANHGTWVSIHPYFRPALEDTVRFAEQEIRRIETAAAQPAADPTPSAVWRAAVAAIKTGDAAAARNAISNARNARMSGDHISQLEALAANIE